MSPQKRRPQARKGRTAAAARAGGRRTDRTAWIAAAVIIAIGGGLVFAFASSASKKNKVTGDSPAPAALVAKVTTGVSAATAAAVGLGSATPLPQPIPGKLLKDASGKPRIVYIGAEYCPYCAAERWAMVNALSRFGTFKDLKITKSEVAPEVYPQTPTFSFYKASYTSDYVVFEPVETETNTKKALETPTAAQAALQAKWDVPPYEQTSGAIPFIDFGDLYMIAGASYDPGVLGDKSHDQIASAMDDPNSSISKGAVGAANAMTATICLLTDNKPASACTSDIQAISAQIKAQAIKQ